ncbi:hypothetical protein Tco_0868469 [Tanacetum coccineum]
MVIHGSPISQTTEKNGITTLKMSTPATAEEKIKRKNDVKARVSIMLTFIIHKLELLALVLNTPVHKYTLASFSDNPVNAFMVKNPNVVPNVLHQDLEQIHEDDLEAMDLKWQLSLLKINKLKAELKKLKQAKDAIDFKIEKFDKASKDLDQLLGSQITDKSKKGFGYCAVPSPHPFIYNRPNKLDRSYSSLDEFKVPEFKGYECGCNTSKKVSEAEPNKVRENNDAPIIEDWVSDDEEQDESITKPEKKTITPTAAKIEKVVRKSVRTPVNTVRPRVINTARQNRTSVNAARANGFNTGKLQHDDKGFVDSGCSRHMTGSIAYLSNFKQFDGGYVAFGGGAYGGKILGKGVKPKLLMILKSRMKCLNNENAEQERFSVDSSSKDVNAVGQQVNTASLDVNTGSLELNAVGPSVSTASPNEEDSTEEEPEVDLENITNSYIVPTTPNTRIHKDHPIDNVIGEVYIAKALFDSSWVEAMHEELLQFKLQQVWILVDFPNGKNAIGTKWVFRNKKDERGIVIMNKASDYAGATLDRKSTTGGCQFLGNRLISWQCKKQTVVATSTTEAEYMAAASCCGQVLWIQNQLLDYGYNFMKTVINIDNNRIKTRLGISKEVRTPRYLSLVVSLTKVGDEAVHKELGDRMERAATTTSSLEAEQDIGSGPRCQDTILGDVNAQTRFEITSKQSINPPLSRGYTLGSGEDSMKLIRIDGIFEVFHSYISCLWAKSTAWNEFSSSMASLIICLATNQKFNLSKYIFDAMVKHLDGGVKFLMYPRFLQVFINQQLGNMSTHKKIFVNPFHTKKVFANMKRAGKDFSGRITPLFDTMMVQPIEEMGEDSDHPTDSTPIHIIDQPSSSSKNQDEQPL